MKSRRYIVQHDHTAPRTGNEYIVVREGYYETASKPTSHANAVKIANRLNARYGARPF